MTGGPSISATVQRSFTEVLVRLAGERPGLLVVCGDDVVPIGWFNEIWPERLIPVGPGASRLGVAEGIRLGGGDAVVILDEAVTQLPLVDSPVLLVSSHVHHVGAAYRAGMTVCQPGWDSDLPALLIGSLGAGETVLLHLAAPMPGVSPVRDPDRATFGEPRILQRGRAGLLVGAGPTATVAAIMAKRLSAKALEVTAVDNHTLSPASGIDPTVLQDHLLVGPLTAPRAGALTEVPIDPADLAPATNRILELLRGGRRR